MRSGKAFKGLPMEGPIATWYARNTGRDRRRFIAAAHAVMHRVAAGGRVLEVAPGPGFLAIGFELKLARRSQVLEQTPRGHTAA